MNKEVYVGRKPGIRTRYLFLLLVVFFTAGLIGCGGSGSDSGGGEITGTGFHVVRGTVAEDSALVGADVTLRGGDGSIASTITDSNGNFEIEKFSNNGTFLVRAQVANGKPIYSVAESQDGEVVIANVHPYTDLIVRNWFAQRGLDITEAFNEADNDNFLPDIEDVERSREEISAIFKQALLVNNAPENFNFISSIFDADGSGFDGFLDRSIVSTANNQINISIIDASTLFQNTVIENIELNRDFSSAEDFIPEMPADVRALVTEVDNGFGSIKVVWTPATDDEGIAGYTVYRNGVEIGTTPFSNFTDTNLTASESYSYEIEAVDGNGQLSGRTQPTPPKVVVADEDPPSMPEQLEINASGEALSLAWTQAELAETAGFIIFRGPSGAADENIARVTSTHFTDFDIVAGTEYCYRLVSFDAADNQSSSTSEICGSIDGLDPGPSRVSFTSSSYIVSESLPTIAISVDRLGEIAGEISVAYEAIAQTASDGADFVAASGSFVWSDTDSNSKTFTLQVLQDDLQEGNESIRLSLSNPSANTSIGATGEATLIIEDVEAPDCVDLEPTAISTDTTLDLPCYTVNFAVEVLDGATLTIEPGVRLVFENRLFDVKEGGRLNAVGTAAEPIYFTAAVKSPGSWGGLLLESSEENILKHVVIEYGGGAPILDPANLWLLSDSNASIENVVSRFSANYGITANFNANISNFNNNISTLNNSPIVIAFDNLEIMDSSNAYLGNTEDTIVVRATDINSDQTINYIGLPYHLVSDISTNINAGLTLQAGVEIVFSNDGGLTVNSSGSLTARGTSSRRVVFTGAEQSKGYWRGIEFISSNSMANIIDFALVEYAGLFDGNPEALVGFVGTSPNGRVTNSILRSSPSNGIWINAETTGDFMTGNVFEDIDGQDIFVE